MGKGKLPPEYMLPPELAKRMCLSVSILKDELRADAEREIKRYPFANAYLNENTGTWQYRIHRARFEKWEKGELNDAGEIAAIVAAKVIEQIQELSFQF